jgi:acylphosphatase
MTVFKRVIYSGRVQGVGFRYTVFGLAKNYSVAGTVRNRSDGSVELLAQGESVEVEAFLAAIARQMNGFIADQMTSDTEGTEMTGFRIIS